MATEIRAGFRSFKAAEDYFRQKVNVPTRRWDDLWQGMHARAFTVAGATQEALLTDLRGAVDAAISQGETLADFRARFDDIVKRHGWGGWKGSQSQRGRAWRTQLIYHQNLRTAYQAGRWETLKKFPFLKYEHNSTLHPRKDHLSWNGKIIARDDPWWNTHYPPNGWGCRCSTVGISAARMRADGLRPDSPPPAGPGDPPPEWAYHVGEAASGKPIAADILKAQNGGRMELYDTRGPEDFRRPSRVPTDKAIAQPLGSIDNAQDLRAAFQAAIGGESAVFVDPAGARVNVTDALIDHWLEDPARLDGRERFLPLLRETIEQPFEIWTGFERNMLTGKVEIRRRYVKIVDLGRTRTLGLVAESIGGQWISLTFFRGSPTGTKGLRQGYLVWGREVGD